jgi:hypothetical protein
MHWRGGCVGVGTRRADPDQFGRCGQPPGPAGIACPAVLCSAAARSRCRLANPASGLTLLLVVCDLTVIEASFQAGKGLRRTRSGSSNRPPTSATATCCVASGTEGGCLPRGSSTKERAARAAEPSAVAGRSRSGQFLGEGREVLRERFVHCTDADIPGATHVLNLQGSDRIATAGFLQRRPGRSL